jgi:NitT/TauT family transport system substrate-binding protein
MLSIPTRRHFLAGLSAVGAASLLGSRSPFADEPSPEVTALRLNYDPTICAAPELIAEALLRAEGFADISYLPIENSTALARGEIDFLFESSAWIAHQVDAGAPVTALAGIHVGCFELFAHDPIRTISDLKGRRVALPQTLGSTPHLLLATMVTFVGLDPQTDIEWVTSEGGSPMEAFIEGRVDAFLAFPPEPQELRERGIGRVILNTGTERPWSQYFCCTSVGNRDFVRAHPIATKRYLRAILKTADLCATRPEQAARQLVEAGFTGRYDHALQTLNEIPYQWREYDPEDALRFFALRLHQVGMISSTPNTILAQGTDWRFLNELKQELKA